MLISELYLNETWYVINDSEAFYFTGTSGVIDQTIWEELPDGPVLIRFYATDSADNLGYAEVIAAKNTETDSPPPTEPINPTIPGMVLPLIAIIVVADIIRTAKIKNRKTAKTTNK